MKVAPVLLAGSGVCLHIAVKALFDDVSSDLLAASPAFDIEPPNLPITVAATTATSAKIKPYSINDCAFFLILFIKNPFDFKLLLNYTIYYSINQL